MLIHCTVRFSDFNKRACKNVKENDKLQREKGKEGRKRTIRNLAKIIIIENYRRRTR